ncbi:MAG: M48 family metalloprotease [Phycisphaera sp.]|nr:M48 family metalloprotease [Phycisphaera sp.]
MQLYVIILMMGLMAYRQMGPQTDPILDAWPWLVPVLAIAPFLVISLFAWIVYHSAFRAVRRRPERCEPILTRLRMFSSICQWGLALMFLVDLFALGWLEWLRVRLGDLILVNDVLALSPVFGALMLMWAAYYPIDRYLRGAHPDDEGRFPRLRFIASQVRHQLLLMMAPLLLLLGWMQIVDRYVAAEPYHSVVSAAGLIIVFMFAPLMIRFVWDTVPLPPSELHNRLLDLCRKYHVRVRTLLMWRTHGGMVNGAVMGIVGRLRYILLTDGLIERMDPDHVEAVMAHELGHVTRRHIPWMLVCAAASISVVAMAISGVQLAAESLGWRMPETWEQDPNVQVPIIFVLTMGFAVVFGYISRRFERQADTFAVQHMTERLGDPAAPGVITAEAVHVVTEALTQVAKMNHIPLGRPSTIWEAMTPMNWRHGSIPWRIAYLDTLVGQRVDDCPIDRKVRRIRWVCAAVLLAAIILGGAGDM